MGKRLPALSPVLRQFIEAQPVYFVATAAPGGHVNVSPKGLDSLRVLSPGRLAWLNVTGSGNETAAHLLESPRMTLMFCAFQGPPMILRLYGAARMVQPNDAEWAEVSALFPPLPGARQVFVLDIGLVQTSCGMAVPLMAVAGQRGDLNAWAEARGPEGLRDYRAEKNAVSLDGLPTGLPEH